MAARVGTDRQENRADGPGGSKWKSWLRILGGLLASPRLGVHTTNLEKQVSILS